MSEHRTVEPGRLRRTLWTTAAVTAATLALVGASITWWWWDVPTFQGPETFLELKGDLAEVRVEPLLAAEEQAYAVEMRSSRGWTVRGYLRVPTAAHAGPWPGIVVLGGIGTGRKAAYLVRPREPHVVLGLDYPWGGSPRPRFLEIVSSLPEIRRSVLLTPAALLLATDYLASRPDTRGDGLTAIGASFGVPFVTAAAALDERFDTVLLVHGGGDLHELIRSLLKRRNPRAPGWLADVAARVMEPVEPMRYASAISPRYVLMVNGLQDERIPHGSVYSLYAAARDPKTLVWLDTPHITARDEGLLQTIADTAIRILESLERPMSHPSPQELRRPETATILGEGSHLPRVLTIAR